jgi:hypothetical protein
MPFARQVDRRPVVNAGSVGMPYGAPGPSWALLTPEEVDAWVDEYLRTNYSDAEALEAFRPRAGG